MRLTLSVASRRSPDVIDVVVNAEPDCALSEILQALPNVQAGDEFYLGSDRIDPDTLLSDSSLCDGAIVQVGSPGTPAINFSTIDVEVRVVSGPAAGSIYPIGSGRHVIGRNRGCSIVIGDPDVSREHSALELTRSSELSIEDLGSTNGTECEGTRVTDAAYALSFGDLVRIGRTHFVVERVSVDRVPLAVDPDGGRILNRHYRIPNTKVESEFAFPNPPRVSERAPFPWLMMVLPLVVAVGLAALLRRPEYLLLAVMSPVMTLGSTMNDRKARARRHSNEQGEYDRQFIDVQNRLSLALVAERRNRRGEAPDAAITFETAVGPGRRLWERRASDDDFLELRVGSGNAPSRLAIANGPNEHETIWATPHSLSLCEAGVVGIAGPRSVACALANSFILQLAVWHSPDDVRVVLVTDEPTAEAAWNWIRWLPHTRTISGRSSVGVGNTPETRLARIRELQDIVAERRGDQDHLGDQNEMLPALRRRGRRCEGAALPPRHAHRLGERAEERCIRHLP